MSTTAREGTLSTGAARDKFAEVLNRAAFGKERVVLTSRGKPLVAMVPIEDVEVLEQLEDQADAEQARGADGMAGRRLPLGFSGTRFSWSAVNRAMTYAVELGRSEGPARGTIRLYGVLCATSAICPLADSNLRSDMMIPRFLSIAAVILVLGGGATLTYAAEENPALVREVQGMLIKRGYLKDYHKDWDQCSQRAAATFLSDQGKLKAAPDLSEIADELKKAPADARRTDEPVC